MDKSRLNIRVTLLTVALVLAIISARLVYNRSQGPLTAPAPMATWPWPHAIVTTPHPGVNVWTDRSSSNGDILRLIRFDFDANPNLRFAIYDQNSDDAHPRDDSVDFWPMGVAQATAHVNGKLNGHVVAACNGLFFSEDLRLQPPMSSRTLSHGLAHHVGSTVDEGVVRYNVGNPRWTFGVKYDDHGRPTFAVVFRPDRQTLAGSFTFAAAGAQCLVRNGQPLKLETSNSADDLSASDQARLASSPDRAGDIPMIDLVKAPRVSFGWSRDSHQLDLLFVRLSGSAALDATSRAGGGWDLADEQRFWQKFGAWNAINSDGGAPAQLSLIDPAGKYSVLPASGASPLDEIDNLDLSRTIPQTTALPQGGSLMYFYIYDAAK